MEVRSHLQSYLAGTSESLDKLRKEILWTTANEPIGGPDEPVTLTWAQLTRLFACQQMLIEALEWNEKARIDRIMGQV